MSYALTRSRSRHALGRWSAIALLIVGSAAVSVALDSAPASACAVSTGYSAGSLTSPSWTMVNNGTCITHVQARVIRVASPTNPTLRYIDGPKAPHSYVESAWGRAAGNAYRYMSPSGSSWTNWKSL